MQNPEPEYLIFEREVGGVDCELTVTCSKTKETTAKVPPPDLKQEAPPELTPDQAYVCDHATD